MSGRSVTRRLAGISKSEYVGIPSRSSTASATPYRGNTTVDRMGRHCLANCRGNADTGGAEARPSVDCEVYNIEQPPESGSATIAVRLGLYVPS
jgi:hypothetical protein